MSGITTEKAQIISQIKRLGGEYIADDYKRATHLITSHPSKTEKCLAACSIGLYILPPTYIFDSFKNNSFLNEDLYSDGNEIVKACTKWRLKLGNYLLDAPTQGVFSNWNCILLISPSKKPGFVKVLQTGFATIVDTRQIDYSTVTHCFWDDKVVDGEFEFILQECRRNGVCVVEPSFIADYLYLEKTPSIEDSLYKK